MTARRIRDFLKGYPRCLAETNMLVLLAVLVLAAIGLAFVYGAGQQSGGAFAMFWRKQLVWLAVGSVGMLIVMRLDYEWMKHWWWAIYAGSVGLLMLVLVVGEKINGARSWLRPAPSVTIQPSEFAKVGLIVALSWWVSKPGVDLKRPSHAGILLLLTAIPVCLIGLQPDYGSALTLMPIAVALLFIGGMPKRWIVYAVVGGILAAPFVYMFVFSKHQAQRIQTFAAPFVSVLSEDQRTFLDEQIDQRAKFLSETRRKRLKGLLNPEIDLQDAGWNAHQSLLAVGSGGLLGKGYGRGTQNPLGFLPRPVSTTDFIFSVIAEETGFVGSTVVIAFYLLLVTTAIYIGTKARDPFGRCLAFAISVLLSVHIYVNIGMTMGMAPIIGIPLPFVSYGGSFMIAMLAAVGILQSVYVHRHDDTSHHQASQRVSPA